MYYKYAEDKRHILYDKPSKLYGMGKQMVQMTFFDIGNAWFHPNQKPRWELFCF